LKLRNKFEKRIYAQLKRAKAEFKYESEKILYVIAGHYLPDFVIKTPTGKVYIETKGYLRPEDKRKLQAVKKCNPQLDIRLVFYEERPKQVKWAEKYGFRYTFETIPKEWLQGL
jgi:predicted nuclease of restriction endonuclease-like RecB superfamily